MPLFSGGEKIADTALLPHQQRVVDKIQNQPGILVYHKMGKGKCLDGETLIQTSEGIFSIRELFSSFSSIDADEIFAPPAKPLFVNSFQKESIEWKKVRNLYRQKINEPLINVKTHRGNSIKVTQEHPFLVARQEGLVWVKSSQLRIGDYICMASYINSTHNLCLGQDLPSLLAWQITEGWESSKKYACSITQKGEGCFIIQDLAQKVLKYTVKIQKPKKGCTFIRFYSKAYGNLLTSLGYEWGHKSANKKMPSTFSCLDRPTMAKFLQIMFDAEGHAGTCEVEFSSASKRLIEQVKSLLLVFGIRSSFSVMRKCATNGSRIYRTYYRILISGEDLRIFEKEIRFLYKYKNEALEKSASKKHNPNTGIPYISNIQNLINLGATNSMFALSAHNKNTISKDRAKKLIKKLEYFLEDFDFTKNLKGTAGNFYKRTCDFITNNRSSILDSKIDLERLCRLPIRYELVEELAETKSSDTYVYDLEIDSDVYDEKNYIAGSGGFVVHNTVSALSSLKALNKPSTVITPAALKSNFLQEQDKHLDTKLPMDMDTLENVARKQTGKKNPILVVDEAHRARTPGSKTLSALKSLSSDAEKTMLLTGTPMVNSPSDIAPLINIVSKEKLLPEAKDEFEKKYVYNKKINPSFLQQLKGIKPGEKQVINKHEVENLRNIFNKWVDYEPGSTEGFPTVEEQDIEVPMSKKQLAIYDSLMGTAPSWLAAKVRSNLPPNKQEAISLNKYLSGARQVGNTPRGFTIEEIDSPKIRRAYEELKKILDIDPQNKGVVYSNFLESGLSPYGDLLKKENIPFGEISGRVPQATRDQYVKDYNEGKLRALLLSPAAQQGLNLKGSTLMQLLDPAWNEPSLDQAKARAIRYQSHAHLPEEKRKVLVQKFLATRPKSLLQRMGVADKEYAVDEYLKNLSRDKAELVGQFEDLMRPQEKTAVKAEDKVKQFNETKDYSLVLKNVSSPKFRKLLIEASDDPRFHNFLNNAGKHFSGREKEKHQVESATKKNTMYDVKLHKDGSYTCSCLNYLYKRGPDNGECKHIVGIKGQVKTAILGTALLAGGLHFGTNAAMKALKGSHLGHSLESAQFATGMRNALQGKKLHPVAKDVMQYGIGPESMVSMDAGSLLGKHLSTLSKAKQFKNLKKIRKAVGMTESIKNAPIVKDVVPGINRHLSGNTTLLDKIPTVPINHQTTKLQKALSLGLGAGAVAADPHSIVHMGINAIRKGVGESVKGQEFMKNQFMSGIKNKPLNPALSTITDIAVSPAALDTRRIGEAAYKESQNPRLKNILNMLSGS